MEYKNIIFDVKDGIGYVTMNRQKFLQNLTMYSELLTKMMMFRL